MKGPSSSSLDSWKGVSRGPLKHRTPKALDKKLGLPVALPNVLTGGGESGSLPFLGFLWAWFLLAVLLTITGFLNLLTAFQPPPTAPLAPSLLAEDVSLAASGAASQAAGGVQNTALSGRIPVPARGEGAAGLGLGSGPATQTSLGGAGAAGAGVGGATAAGGSRVAMEVAGAAGAAVTRAAAGSGGGDAAAGWGATALGSTGAGQAGSGAETDWGASSSRGAGAGVADVRAGPADVSTLQAEGAAHVSSAGGAVGWAATGGAAVGGQGSGVGGAVADTGSVGAVDSAGASAGTGAQFGSVPFSQSAAEPGLAAIGSGVTGTSTESTQSDMSSGLSRVTNGRANGVSAEVGGTNPMAGGENPWATGTARQAGALQILGTPLLPGESVTEFKNRWACILDYHTAGWELDPMPRPLPWPTLGKAFPSCARREGFLGEGSNADVSSGAYSDQNWPVAQSLKYVWKLRKGASCSGYPPQMGRFAGEAFCAAMQRSKGPLFVIGDSTSGQFYSSLLEQLKLGGVPVAQQEPTASCSRLAEEMLRNGEAEVFQHTWPICARFLVCGPSLEEGGVHVHFALSQHLGGVTESSQGPREPFWGEDLERERPAVVLLSRGAHYVKNERFVAELESTLREVRRLAGGAMVIFRSTTTGHPQCQEYDTPLEIPQPLDSAPGQWQFFAQQNNMAKALVEIVGGFFFNVETMNSVRPDWHVIGQNKDCWHHCQRGPVDDWVRVFVAMLSEAL